MAKPTASRVPAPTPGRGPRLLANSPPGSLSDHLRLAIAESRDCPSALGKKSGVHHQTIRLFVRREVDLKLATADRLANVLAVKVVRGSEDTLDDSPQTPSDALRSAIADDPRSNRALARAAGVSSQSIGLFVRREADLNLASADKLLNVLPIKVVREARCPGSGVADPPTRPIADALRSAIAENPRSMSALAKDIRCKDETIWLFVRRESDLKLGTADKLANVVGIKLIRKARHLGSEADESPTQSLSDTLRSAIVDAQSIYELARESGVDDQTIYGFFRREADLMLGTAEKLFNVLRVEVVREAKAHRPELSTPITDPPQPSADALRSAIAGDKRSIYALAKQSGVSEKTIGRLAKGQDLTYSTRIKLADALGLQVHSAEVSTPAGAQSAPGPTRRCPVELRGEGFPIIVHEGSRELQLPKMSGVAYQALKFVVDAFPGGGYTPGELRTLTVAERAMRLFAQALQRDGFEPLRRMILSWAAGRGKVIEIVDAGPRD